MDSENEVADAADVGGTAPEAHHTIASLLDWADGVQRGDRAAVVPLMRELVPRTYGETSQVISVLCKKSGIDRDTLKAMLKDERCRFGEWGVLTRPGELADAWVKYTKETMPGGDVVYTLGDFWVFSNLEGEYPVYSKAVAADIEASLENDLPHHPLIQQAGSQREVISRAAAALRKDGFFEGAPAGLPMHNGFLSLDANSGIAELLPHGPEHRMRHILPADYDPHSVCPAFEAGLALVMPDGEARVSLQEMLGCAIFNVRLQADNARSVVLIKGPPGSGKSTMGYLLSLFVPPGELVSLQPADMEERFMPVVLAGKRLNLVTELDTERPLGGAIFKAIASREQITTRGIRQSPTTFSVTLSHVLLCNELPLLRDKTGAFSRRMCVYTCPRTLTREEIDPLFRDKVAAEMSGVTNWLLEGVRRAVERGYFAKPPENDELLAEMRCETDLVRKVISLRVERTDRAAPAVTNQQLFDAVRAHAVAKGIDISEVSNGSLGRRVAKALRELHGVEQEATKAHGGVPQYRGIKILAGREVALREARGLEGL